MSLRMSGSNGTPRAASHLDTSIDRPVPYRCSTAKKISPVAAAISAAINHSSKWSSARLSTLSTRIPHLRPKRPGARSLPTVLLLFRQRPASVHLDVEFLCQQIEHLLPDAALGPCVCRTHGDLPGLALIVCQIMQCGLAGFLDLGQRVLVFLDRDRIGVIGRLVHRFVKLLANI